MRRLLPLVIFVFLLAACGGQPSPTGQTTEIEVTRQVEVEVTRLVETEVTRLVEIVVTAAPSPTPEPSPAPEIDPSLYIAGAGISPDDLPAGDNGLSVVLVGPPSTFGAVPAIVRNNTDTPVYNIEVSATARNAAGNILGTGPGRDFYPSYVPPGGVAFGRILFEDTPLDGASIEYSVTADDDPGFIFARRDMEIVEHSLVGGNIVGLLVNHHPTALDLTKAAAICFDESLTPTTIRDSYTDQDRVEAGAELPFSVDLLGDEAECGRYLLAGLGRETD